MSNAQPHSETLPDGITDARPDPPGPELRDLFVFEAGALAFAVPADQVDGTTKARVPAVLPHAPQAILGVVCARGRMLTVFDPTVLLTGQALRWPHSLPCVIALRGEEQLALAAQRCRDQITVEDADIVRSGESAGAAAGLLLGRVRYGGEEILVLDVKHLFTSAIRQRERRRRRF